MDFVLAFPKASQVVARLDSVEVASSPRTRLGTGFLPVALTARPDFLLRILASRIPPEFTENATILFVLSAKIKRRQVQNKGLICTDMATIQGPLLLLFRFFLFRRFKEAVALGQ
jgi:hypothetical protein